MNSQTCDAYLTHNGQLNARGIIIHAALKIACEKIAQEYGLLMRDQLLLLFILSWFKMNTNDTFKTGWKQMIITMNNSPKG